MDGWNTFLSFLGQKAHFQSIYLLFVSGYGYFRSIDILNIFFPKVGGFNPLKHMGWNHHPVELFDVKQKDAFLAISFAT